MVNIVIKHELPVSSCLVHEKWSWSIYQCWLGRGQFSPLCPLRDCDVVAAAYARVSSNSVFFHRSARARFFVFSVFHWIPSLHFNLCPASSCRQLHTVYPPLRWRTVCCACILDIGDWRLFGEGRSRTSEYQRT